MGIAKYYEDNMEIINERMRDSNFNSYTNTYIASYPDYISKKNISVTPQKTPQGYILRNYECNGIEIYFGVKPNYLILSRLRQNAWSWHHQKKCWFKKYSETNEWFAKYILAL